MKRNESASKASSIVTLVGIVVAAVLSGCAVTGPASSGDLDTAMPYNEVHYGP